MRYAILIEHAGTNYPAHALDLPCCVTTGDTVMEAEAQFREVIAFHLDGIGEEEEAIPAPSSRVDYVDVAA